MEMPVGAIPGVKSTVLRYEVDRLQRGVVNRVKDHSHSSSRHRRHNSNMYLRRKCNDLISLATLSITRRLLI
jgi:hypothetical protein